MSGRPTIYSIAQELGIHASTVSRAFNRPDMVRPEVRELVLAKAQEVGYEPNAAARGLTTGHTGLLGLLIPDIENPFFAPVVRSIQRAAQQSGLKVLLMDSEREASSEPGLLAQVRSQVDGFVLVSPRSSPRHLVEAVRDTPLVLVNRVNPGTASVVINNDSAIRGAGDHLLARGHRRFALLRGPAQSWAAGRRTRTVRSWARGVGVELMEVGPLEALFDGGLGAAAQLRDSGATAVLAFDDLMACGTIVGLVQLGCSVPDDISVLGCDDVLLARTFGPPLSTIAAPFNEIGPSTLEALHHMRATPSGDRGAAPQIQLDGRLVLRASTGPAPLP